MSHHSIPPAAVPEWHTRSMSPSRHNSTKQLGVSPSASSERISGHPVIARKDSVPRDRKVYKAMKQSYRHEKKKMEQSTYLTLHDPSTNLNADYIKIRGALKNWLKYFCIVKPGMLVIYWNEKLEHWVATLLLAGCEVVERPSKKEGFCFKIYHPINRSVWCHKGPKGETATTLQPLPRDHLILRAPSETEGRVWLDAVEVAIRSASKVKTSAADDAASKGEMEMADHESLLETTGSPPRQSFITAEMMKDATCEMDSEGDSDYSGVEGEDDAGEPKERQSEKTLPESTYAKEEVAEELGQDSPQTEEMDEGNKSFLWAILKQVRPGMDLSKVVLPTFILETRSFLDKLCDYYYHSNLLVDAVREDDALCRIQRVVKWYMSGFYKKPKGLKKPYNPVIGEMFRCMWPTPETDSRTFYVSEQVSHHPPVSAFYVSNRKDGYVVNGTVLTRSKFYGNSTDAIIEGTGVLHLLPRGEEYHVTMPYVHCKGLLVGSLSMELGGQVTVSCVNTGYSAELDFKLKKFWKSSCNQVTGKIRLGKETLCTLDGKWDEEICITDCRTGETETLFHSTPEVREQRLKRHLIPFADLEPNESMKLWNKVTEGLQRGDQEFATAEKTIIEDAQRSGERERKSRGEAYPGRLFERDESHPSGWVYRHMDTRAWDKRNDLYECEHNGVIRTVTRVKAPLHPRAVRQSSQKSLLRSREMLVDTPATRVIPPTPDIDDSSSDIGKLLKEQHNFNRASFKQLEKMIDALRKTQEARRTGFSLPTWLVVLLLAIIVSLLLQYAPIIDTSLLGRLPSSH